MQSCFQWGHAQQAAAGLLLACTQYNDVAHENCSSKSLRQSTSVGEMSENHMSENHSTEAMDNSAIPQVSQKRTDIKGVLL